MKAKHIQKFNVNSIKHWPTLKTVLMVEETLKNNDIYSIEDLKRKLPKKIMDQTLRVILSYFEYEGWIIVSEKGIVWIKNDNPEFLKMLEKAEVSGNLRRI